MAFREVTLGEVREVLRQWLSGASAREIARRTGLDRGTVRRYVEAAVACGLSAAEGGSEVGDEGIAAVLSHLQGPAERERGEGWARCESNRSVIETRLGSGVRLRKVQRLLAREGVAVPYSTLWRFATSELGFGSRSTTIPVLDGEPGGELQVDTAWMTRIDDGGRLRRFRVWIFTAVRSRHRFVYPTWRETTEDAIEACEAAWAFFGGVFRVLVPDNTKAIVTTADSISPRITTKFLEYAQSRGFVIDPARVRSPQDKGRVERSVQTVRDDCFGGEVLRSLDGARHRAMTWCRDEYGMRRHGTTARLPLEVFDAEEKPRLLPAPASAYEVPLWAEAKVSRDQHVIVAGAFYSVGRELVGRRLTVRADRTTVRLYANRELVKAHPRVPRGQRSTDREDFPPEKAALAFRDAEFYAARALGHGETIGRFARVVLAGDQPWTKLRAAGHLLRLVQRYGRERVEPACARLLEADGVDVRRLERLLQQSPEAASSPAPVAQVIHLARFLRPSHQFRLPLETRPEGTEETR